MFPTSTLHTAPYGLERFGNHGSQQEQAKAAWISLFCLQISFVLACFWSIEPLKIQLYCGIKVNGSKDKQSRFLQVTIDQCMAHSLQSLYKASKTDFLCTLNLLRMVYLNLQNVDFLLKGFSILHSVTRIMVKTCNCSCNRNMYLLWSSNVYK